MDDRLRKQLEFIVEVDKSKEILRRTLLTQSKRRENDAEHAWHLSLMAPILKEYIKEDIDMVKVINMVTIHDLVEIDAGDTYCYDTNAYKTKEIRERKAADRIFNILPKDQAQFIYELWNEFEEMKTPESRYANTLDRLQPILNNIATGGVSWKENKTKKSMVLKRMEIIKDTSNELYNVVLAIIDKGIKMGVLIDE